MQDTVRRSLRVMTATALSSSAQGGHPLLGGGGEVVGAHVLVTLWAVVFAGKCNGGASPVGTGIHWTFSGWARGLRHCQCNHLWKPAEMIP